MTLLIVYLLIALFFSFLCSIMEAVILSVTPSFIATKLGEKKSYALILQKYKDNIDRPLAAILTLNTFAHTVGAAGVGAQAQLIWGNQYLSLTSAILTILILFFSEIIPKTIGANFWKELVGPTVFVLRVLMIILYPFVIVSQLITKIFNINKYKSVLSRSDFSALAKIAEKEGVFASGESKIIQNIARFHKLKVKEIMTPRTVLFAAQEDMTIGQFYSAHPNLIYTRVPVYRKSIDEISGYFLKNDMLSKIIEGEQNLPLKDLKRDIILVYENLPIPNLYDRLTQHKEHIAIVIDEFGGTEGVVTMEDVFETIIGIEITDETDHVVDLQKTARESWEKRAKRMGLDIENDRRNDL
jgi:CBS domain containing-hemolysin-like protein